MNGYKPGASHSVQNGQYYPPEARPQGSTFAFRKRWGQIDWRSLASVDVDRIAREMDFQSLQQNIMNVTFCNIESEEFRNVDPNFIKLFRLSQLIIEYLLHSQQYLSEQGGVLEQRIQESQQELESVRSSLSVREEELKAVKKENRKRRKVIEAYQEMMSAGATGLHTCPVCQREFVSAEYLQSHIHRRHPEHLSLVRREEEKKPVVTQEELERRLMDQLSERLQASEAQLRQEMARKEQEAVETQAREFEEWKQREQERMRHEMQEFQAPILSELRTLQQENAELEEALHQKQAELETAQTKRRSHLGQLEGAEELDIVGGSRVRAQAEVAHMKEQLESQVQEMQSKLRKQERSWQKKMHKFSSTYQDQLKESLDKVQALEQSHQSMHSSMQRERLQEQSHLTQELKTLEQKVKQQEKQLVTQQWQLTSLQSRETSPVPSSPPPASPTHATPQVHTHPTIMTDSALQPDSGGEPSDSGEESYTEEEEEEEEGDDGEGEEEVDTPGFAPFPHRPMIRTKYNHRPEVLGNIKREMQGILSDALTQRGLSKAGLTVAQFEDKMGALEQERQQRIQTHYNFLEHRERLSREVDAIAATDCVFEPPKDLQLPHKMRKLRSGKTDLGSSLPGRSGGKPPKPTSSKLASSLPLPASVPLVTATPQAGPSQAGPSHATQVTEVHPITKPAVKVTPLESESDSELGTEGSSEEDEVLEPNRKLPSPTPHPPTSQTPQLIQVGRPLSKEVKMEEEEDSPWDSEEDSIEALAARDLAGRASSTPIKAIRTSLRADLSRKVRSLRGSVDLEPDPSKRPVGGVALFPQPQKTTTIEVESDSDDTFNLTESSNAAATAQSKQVNPSLRVSDSGAHPGKPISRTATSHSALTTVSVDDFEDSDFSDLEITRLT